MSYASAVASRYSSMGREMAASVMAISAVATWRDCRNEDATGGGEAYIIGAINVEASLSAAMISRHAHMAARHDARCYVNAGKPTRASRKRKLDMLTPKASIR